MSKLSPDYSLYLVTDRSYLGNRSLEAVVAEAIAGGVTLVQLREKDLTSRGFYQQAVNLQRITKAAGVPLIINDRLDIALVCDADGLHIGQEDLPVAIARELLGSDKILGVSVTKVEEALAAEAQGADYLGVGAMFPTATKEAEVLSIAELTRIKQATKLPVVAIGGINAGNVQQLKASGVDGVAVVSAIIAREDVRIAASELAILVK